MDFSHISTATPALLHPKPFPPSRMDFPMMFWVFFFGESPQNSSSMLNPGSCSRNPNVSAQPWMFPSTGAQPGANSSCNLQEKIQLGCSSNPWNGTCSLTHPEKIEDGFLPSLEKILGNEMRHFPGELSWV